jgi:hypothetical protein
MEASLPAEVEAALRCAPEPPEGETLPFFVLAGLMGGDLGERALPSHAGQSLPSSFDTPIVGNGFTPLFQRPGSAPPVSSSWPRQQQPSSPPPSTTAAHRSPASQQRPLPRRGTAGRPAARPARPQLQTLDRVLQKELANGRLGVPGGHFGAPSEPSHLVKAAIMRERGKSRLRDVTMIPTSLRAWESSVERRVAVQRGAPMPRGYGRGSEGTLSPTRAAAGASREGGAAVGPRTASLAEVPPVSAAPTPPPMPPRLTPYEMRRFLQHSQRFLVGCRKEAFAVGPQPQVNVHVPRSRPHTRA